MHTLVRSLLVWLLLLAVPFQGFASAAMLPCASATTMPGHGHHTVPAATGTPGHDHGAMLHAMAKTGQGHDGHGDGQHGNGSCASCCIGAAMAPAAQPRLALARPDFIAIPFRAGHVPSVDPVLPERPPRLILA
jgi:hypothetical protein